MVKAVVQDRYGSLDLLRLEEMVTPTPEDNEVLIGVRAAAVTLSDTITRTGRPLVARFLTGLLRPRQHIQGSEFAGEIAVVGQDVTRFQAGEEVFGVTGGACGCFAQFMTMAEDDLPTIKPANATSEEAASVCGTLAAWNFLHDKAELQPGQSVFVNGASGAIGTAAVQLAKHIGAEVTAACGPGERELVESLGADEVIDDTRQDFTKTGEVYDVIFDTESTGSYRRCRRSLADNGVYLRTFPGPVILAQMLWTSRFGDQTILDKPHDGSGGVGTTSDATRNLCVDQAWADPHRVGTSDPAPDRSDRNGGFPCTSKSLDATNLYFLRGGVRSSASRL